MKKQVSRFLSIAILLLGISFSSQAQRVFVSVRPAAPVMVRPVCPSPRHVWIEGEWVWQRGGYVYRQGYWAVPPPHRVWIAGRWRHARGGWYWAPGYWR